MKHELEETIGAAVKNLFDVEVAVELTRPDEQFGDYATNVALQLAKQVSKNPREIAEALATKLREALQEQATDISVAGPGFLNLKLNDGTLLRASGQAPGFRSQMYKDKVVVAEYSDPSAFKVLHAGHLYTSVVGDAIANLLETAGGKVHRVNFGGDVGRHVAITMWAILKELGGEHPEKLDEVPNDRRPDWMSARYVEGNTAFEDSEQTKVEVIELNKRVYQLHNQKDHDSAFAKIYWTCRQWSYDYFDEFYALIGSKFEKYYPESEVADLGIATVNEQLAKGVYEQSDGAVIFNGKKYGLHTRVFINSEGLPTYEAKDVGLIMQKWADYHFDKSVVITGNEQEQYMAVVLKSIEQFEPRLAEATTHLTHGIVKLKGGVKMSSRKGNILRAVDVLDAAAEANKELTGNDNEETTLGAVKYAFLKNRIGGDIIYDPAESVSISGNSGPYLQYAHARARSILAKGSSSRHSGPDPESSEKKMNAASGMNSNWIPSQAEDDVALEAGERSLVRKIGEYPEVVERAVAELMPHHICTYLYELAQNFNSFYEHNRVIGDPRETVRLQLTKSYADVLKAGLKLLNIPAPEHL